MSFVGIVALLVLLSIGAWALCRTAADPVVSEEPAPEDDPEYEPLDVIESTANGMWAPGDRSRYGDF